MRLDRPLSGYGPGVSAKIDVHAFDENGTTVVVVKGDLDLSTSPQLLEEAMPSTETAMRYVLDLSSVGFVDSTGIGAFVRIRSALRDRGLELHVVPSRRVRAALTLASLETTMVVHDSLEAALQDGTPA